MLVGAWWREKGEFEEKEREKAAAKDDSLSNFSTAASNKIAGGDKLSHLTPPKRKSSKNSAGKKG